MKCGSKGTILITSLWILAILSILAIGIGFRVSIEARLSKYNMDRLKTLYLAKAGILRSQAILSKDINNYDSIRECGIILPPGKELEEVFTEKLSDGAYVVSYDEEGKNYYGMMDEERKININTASPAVLQNLFVNEEVAASIVNWRSPGGTTQMLKGGSDNDYKSLTPPYECKHAPFSCIEELMLLLIDNKPMAPELFDSVKDYITIYGDGKVNINTATKKTMLAFGLGEKAADMIIEFRNSFDKIGGTKDDLVFFDIAAQVKSWDITPNEIAILGNSFTTVSNYFRIESKGMVERSKINSKIACVVKRGDKKLVSYREY